MESPVMNADEISKQPPAGPPATISKPEYKAPLRERCADGLLIIEAQESSDKSPHTYSYTRHGRARSRVPGVPRISPVTKTKNAHQALA